MKLETYLMFNGNCEEAFEYYAKALGGETRLMKWAGSPAEAHAPPGWGDKILHGRVEFGNAVLLGSDAPPDPSEKKPGEFSVCYQANDVKEAEDVYSKLSQSARAITMPFQKTFWSEGFGMLVDQFGIPWMVNTDSNQTS